MEAATPSSSSSSSNFLFIFLFLLSFISVGIISVANGQQRTWCVAKPSSDEATLIQNLNYACSEVDCGVIRKGCPCFLPDNLINHASVAMNLYYTAKGSNQWNCDFKASALIVLTNPSYGNCSYR